VKALLSNILGIGLVSEIVPTGTARSRAEDLALEISNFPEKCMLADRLSAYQQEGLTMEDALKNEFKLGKEVVFSPGFFEGPTRFAQGEGRHGKFKSAL